jgi:hypothetical protein
MDFVGNARPGNYKQYIYEQYIHCQWPTLDVEFTPGKQSGNNAVGAGRYLQSCNSQNDLRQTNAEDQTAEVKKKVGADS